MMTQNIQHSSKTDRWYTPLPILKRVELVLGSIDLDPASDVFGNIRAGANRYIDESEDGLISVWHPKGGKPGNVFLNPPGGKSGNRSLAADFWERLVRERAKGMVTHAIFVCFSIEAMQTTQGNPWPSAGEFTVCIPSRRVRFDESSGAAGRSPSHANAIVYVHGTENHSSEFCREFEDLGTILLGPLGLHAVLAQRGLVSPKDPELAKGYPPSRL